MPEIKYKDISEFKYILLEDYEYQIPKKLRPKITANIVTEFVNLSVSGKLLLKTGFMSDGPSGPTVDTDTFMRGAFIHDALYYLMNLGLLPQSYRKKADKILYAVCREDGMSWVRAKYVYHSVRRLAAWAAKPRATK